MLLWGLAMDSVKALKSVVVHETQLPISSYHKTIKEKLRQRPGLAVLDGFMDNALKTVTVPPRRSLKSMFDIQVIHILESGALDGPVKYADGEKKKFEDAVKQGFPEKRVGTFILGEDLSYDMIETLGITFDLPPSYFALHLKDTEAFRSSVYKQPESPDIDLLPSYYGKIPFYSFQLCRYYCFPEGISDIQKTRKESSNVPRAAYHAIGLPNAALRERATVFLKKDSKGRRLAIVLTDRLLKPENPVGYTYPMTAKDLREDELPFDQLTDRTKQVSCRDEILEWLRTIPKQQRLNVFDEETVVAIRPLVGAMTRAVSIFTHECQNYISRIRNAQHDTDFPDDPDFFLYISRRLCRNLEVGRQHIKLDMDLICARAPHLKDELGLDLEFLRAEMASLIARLDTDVQFMASNLALQQAKLVNFLAKVGIIFVPVGTLAGILSIPDPISRLYIFGGITVPMRIDLPQDVKFAIRDASHEKFLPLVKTRTCGEREVFTAIRGFRTMGLTNIEGNNKEETTHNQLSLKAAVLTSQPTRLSHSQIEVQNQKRKENKKKYSLLLKN
ncbi:MAG: hypothetical protein MMC33_004015 [Icmadophila ericetorum]|nr:hypothetical protein [Icmadophila ericetorum]